MNVASRVLGLLLVGCGGGSTVRDTAAPSDTADTSDVSDPTDTADTSTADTEDPAADTDVACVQHVGAPAGPPSAFTAADFPVNALGRSRGIGSCLVVHDLDGDGGLDVLWSAPVPDEDGFEVVVRWHNGGRRALITRHAVPHLGYACLARDDDDDGDLEILYADASGLARLDGLGARELVRTPVWAAPDALFETDIFSLAAVDLEADGDEDLIVTLSGYVTDCSTASTDTDGTADVILTTDDIDPGIVLCLENTPQGWSRLDAEPCPQALREHATVYPFHLSLQDLGSDGRPEIVATGDFAVNTAVASTPTGFVDISAGSGLGEYNHAMGVAWSDVDGDGFRDMYITDFGPDQLRLNRQCRVFFEAAWSGTGIGETTQTTVTWGVVAEDLDHNGHDEFFLTQNVEAGGPLDGNLCSLFPTGITRPPDFLLARDAAGVFQRTNLPGVASDNAQAWMPAYAASGDIDGDGRVDLLAADEVRGILVFWNEVASAGRWVGVRPVDARGVPVMPVRVVVDEGEGRSRVEELWPVTGTTTHSEPVLRFGLGPRDTPVRVRVRWPDGSWTDAGEVALDAVHTVVRP